jgi:hypothetical protein
MERTVAVVIVSAVLANGCSFVTVHPPSRQGRCTTSVAAPVVDTSVASLAAVGGTALIVAGVGEAGGEDALVTIFYFIPGAILAGVAAIHAASAWWGYDATRRCRARGPALAEP